MGALMTRRVRTTQPAQVPQIDWSNPLTRGLAFAFTHSDLAVGFAQGDVTSYPYTSGGRVNTQAGTGGQCSSTALYTVPAAGGITSSNYSLFAVATATSASVIQSALDMDNGGGSYRYFQFRIANGKADFIPFNTSQAVTGQATAPVALTVAELSRGFTIGATASPTRTAVFQNGVVTAATPSALSTPSNTLPMCVGARPSNAQTWSTGGLSLVAAWNRTLTDAEMQSLADNPWQLFKPASRRLWIAYSAPSGNTAALSWTEADDAVSLAGTLTDSTTIAWTEADDVHAVTATLTDRASVAWNEVDDAVSVTVTANDSTSLSWTEQDDVVAMSGNVDSPSVPVTTAIGWTEQDDAFSAFMQVATGGAPGYGVTRKRYVVRKGGQLLVFTDPELAKQVLHADDEPEPKKYPAKKQAKAVQKHEPKPEPVPEQRVDLDELRALAEKQHAEAEYKRLLAQKQYETMLALLERLREEEEDDWLLMSAD
jgi:putative salt-induced outer membrane protein YdiY